MNNKKLLKQYPWLQPRNRFTDELIPNDDNHTELDEMPEGWRIAFAEEMCKEIHEVLLKTNSVDSYRVLQVKEKYGRLCWYHTFMPLEVKENGIEVEIVMDFANNYDKLEPIINKYEEISKKTCIVCGRPATKIHKNWIGPLCDECVKKALKNLEKQFISLEEI